MNRSHIWPAFLLAFVITSGSLTGYSRAADIVENPRYQFWANFKAGSSNTVTADFEHEQKKIHIQTTKTLISITAEEAVVETGTVARVMGQDRTQPPTRETIKAKTDKLDLKLVGEKDVDAMGKTFKCKVYETGAAAPSENKGTVYVNGDVPGGLVKLDVISPGGITVTFVLTAMEVK